MQPVRSLVGLIPLYATLTLEPGPEVSGRNTVNMKARGRGEQFLLALASEDRLISILEKMLDESEFFSDTAFDRMLSSSGRVDSLSKLHKDCMERHEVSYWPGESKSGMFGGNSNWRSPIWLAVNFLFTESLQRFHQYYGDELQIQHRIIHIFGRDINGRRALNGGNQKLDFDPFFRDYVWFYEVGPGCLPYPTEWGELSFTQDSEDLAHHFFDETLDYQSEHGDDIHSLESAFSANELNTLSPTAL
ncbi:hypothetical protein EDB85DRAFT_1887023 [Lactarius pseudohatsudake]|nr:hypothetical protein EDB85DRAFT_1887023 [Lactarius pseudohatsudake]